MKSILMALLILAAVYFSVAFIEGNINPFTWDKELRGGYILISLSSLILWRLINKVKL